VEVSAGEGQWALEDVDGAGEEAEGCVSEVEAGDEGKDDNQEH
jgi:hypothetical protein